MKENLGKDYKNVAEFNKDINNVDMTIVAQTLYQYMYYQEAIKNTDLSKFATYINIIKESKKEQK